MSAKYAMYFCKFFMYYFIGSKLRGSVVLLSSYSGPKPPPRPVITTEEWEATLAVLQLTEKGGGGNPDKTTSN